MSCEMICASQLDDFRTYLLNNERSAATIAKYLRDIRAFARFAGDRPLSRQLVLVYKNYLGGKYAVSSANSMIAALNAFLRFLQQGALCIRQFKLQRQAYTPEERELTRAEYQRLIDTARERGNERLQLILQTICGTGIRVSELQHITVEAVRQGEALVRCKGKSRTVFIIPQLCRLLMRYVRRRGIASGPVFVTRCGRPVNRTAIWRDMKSLCRQANVAMGKVFPHNLRHLFARTFYGLEKDLAKLADVLGHASINTTRIYIVTTGAEHRKQMEKMDLVFEEKEKPPSRRRRLLTT